MPEIDAGIPGTGPSPTSAPRKGSEFPKSVRLLRSSDFRKVYDQGKRHSCALFAAFYVAGLAESGPRIGFTTPRALGKAVIRNRLRRRVREAVRLELAQLSPEWSIVFNPRRKTLECGFSELQAEVRRLFIRCSLESSRAQSRQEAPRSSSPSSEVTSS